MASPDPAPSGREAYPWDRCRTCGGERDVALAKVCKACIEGAAPFPAVGEGHGDKMTREALYDALVKLAALNIVDGEALERGYTPYKTEMEDAIESRSRLAERLLKGLHIERPASPYGER